MKKCIRQIVVGGKVETIILDEHVFRWSGKIPCTGVRRCLYCNKYEEDLKEEGDE